MQKKIIDKAPQRFNSYSESLSPLTLWRTSFKVDKSPRNLAQVFGGSKLFIHLSLVIGWFGNTYIFLQCEFGTKELRLWFYHVFTLSDTCQGRGIVSAPVEQSTFPTINYSQQGICDAGMLFPYFTIATLWDSEAEMKYWISSLGIERNAFSILCHLRFKS